MDATDNGDTMHRNGHDIEDAAPVDYQAGRDFARRYARSFGRAALGRILANDLQDPETAREPQSAAFALGMVDEAHAIDRATARMGGIR